MTKINNSTAPITRFSSISLPHGSLADIQNNTTVQEIGHAFVNTDTMVNGKGATIVFWDGGEYDTLAGGGAGGSGHFTDLEVDTSASIGTNLTVDGNVVVKGNITANPNTDATFYNLDVNNKTTLDKQTVFGVQSNVQFNNGFEVLAGDTSFAGTGDVTFSGLGKVLIMNQLETQGITAIFDKGIQLGTVADRADEGALTTARTIPILDPNDPPFKIGPWAISYIDEVAAATIEGSLTSGVIRMTASGDIAAGTDRVITLTALTQRGFYTGIDNTNTGITAITITGATPKGATAQWYAHVIQQETATKLCQIAIGTAAGIGDNDVCDFNYHIIGVSQAGTTG